jgi:hypothetical protein
MLKNGVDVEVWPCASHDSDRVVHSSMQVVVETSMLGQLRCRGYSMRNLEFFGLSRVKIKPRGCCG